MNHGKSLQTIVFEQKVIKPTSWGIGVTFYRPLSGISLGHDNKIVVSIEVDFDVTTGLPYNYHLHYASQDFEDVVTISQQDACSTLIFY